MKTLAEIEELGNKFFTEDELENIQYKINAAQESIDTEIENYGSAEDEEPLNFYQAFDDTWDAAYDCLHYSDDKGHRKEAKKYIFRCLEFAVMIGTYKTVTEQEYKDAYIFGGSKAAAFPKMKNGVRCEFVAHPEISPLNKSDVAHPKE